MFTNYVLEIFSVYFNLLNLFTYSHYILGENMVKGTRGAKVKVFYKDYTSHMSFLC